MSTCLFVTVHITRIIKGCSTHAAPIPTPLAPEDSLKKARRSHARTVPQRCEIVKRPPSACVFKRPCVLLSCTVLLHSRPVCTTTVHKSNTQIHTVLGDFLVDRPGNSLWTKINCSRQHVCHHRQSDVATTVCLEKGKAEAKVMEARYLNTHLFFCRWVMVHNSNTQTHTNPGEFLMDRHGNTLWTNINCTGQHICHHRQSDVATRVCLEQGKAEAKVTKTG